MSNHLATTTIFLTEENIIDDQISSEYLKHEIRKFSISFSVSEAKKRNKEINTLKRIWLTTKVINTILDVEKQKVSLRVTNSKIKVLIFYFRVTLTRGWKIKSYFSGYLLEVKK